MSPGALAFNTTDTLSEDVLLAVDAGLEQHNYAVAPLSEVRQLAAFAREASGQIVGGATGRTWGRCCELQQLWVATEVRIAGYPNGIGKFLMHKAEA